MRRIGLIFLQAFFAGIPLALGDIISSTNDVELIKGHSAQITLSASSPLSKSVSLNYTSNNGQVVNVTMEGGRTGPPWNILLEGVALGHDTISFYITPNIADVSQAFVRVTVMRSSELAVMSTVVGWIYFFAWSISFYPQLFVNCKRKSVLQIVEEKIIEEDIVSLPLKTEEVISSVVGLNFDFVSFNMIGFTLYSVFNCGLYWIPSVQAEYFSLHPKGLNPVHLNDVFFSLHAAFITAFTVIQCLIYERGGQTVSTIARVIIGTFLVVVLISISFTIFSSYLTWLEFLSICSYLKLVTTLIKYVPQAFMNYRRKSTVGWSIGNVVLDFTGGILSMLQMIVNADNYDDWSSIFGDPTKFGLGFFSVLFDIFFLIQHYILYKNNHYEIISGDDSDERPRSSAVEDSSQSGMAPSRFPNTFPEKNVSTASEVGSSNPPASADTLLDSPLSEVEDPADNSNSQTENPIC